MTIVKVFLRKTYPAPRIHAQTGFSEKVLLQIYLFKVCPNISFDHNEDRYTNKVLKAVLFKIGFSDRKGFRRKPFSAFDSVSSLLE